MIRHRDKSIKPFQIGQLLFHCGERKARLVLVLDVEWCSRRNIWSVSYLVQTTGKKTWGYAHFFRTIEENK